MKVVSAVNAPYLPLLDVWMLQSGNFLAEKMTVVCMDGESAEYCAQQYPTTVEAINGELLNSRDRHGFWNARLAYLAALIQGGEDLLHTDLDAFWLKDPFPTLLAIDADLIFTKDLGIPKSIREAWGFTLCCGFFIARSTRANRHFFNLWQKRTKELGDDQVAANEILFGKNLSWQEAGDLPDGALWSHCDMEGETLKIVVLPLSCISRMVPFFIRDAIAVHPWFERSLFHSYLDLFRFVFARFGRLNPGIENVPLPPELEIPKSDDECSLATLGMASFALSESPGNSRFLTLRGAMYMRTGDLKNALADLHQAQRLGDTAHELSLWLAQALLQNKEYEQACALVYPLASNRDVGLPTIRIAAQIIKTSSGSIKAGLFLVTALRGFGVKKIFSIARSFYAKKLS